MGYFNYHATAQRLIAEGKLITHYYAEKHNSISPALVLVFNDIAHPKMPIRKERWGAYQPLIGQDRI